MAHKSKLVFAALVTALVATLGAAAPSSAAITPMRGDGGAWCC
jgi:hypothetical protein